MIHILVVDDEADIDILAVQRFRREIQEGTYSFSFARNGQEALEVIGREPGIRLVITDINMPHMNGLELLFHLQKNVPHIRTIIVSAYGDSESLQQAALGGAAGFINKPINFSELKDLISKQDFSSSASC